MIAVSLSVKDDWTLRLSRFIHSFFFLSALFMVSDPWVRAQGGNYHPYAS